MSGQVWRDSPGEYQADERAGVARLSWRVSGGPQLCHMDTPLKATQSANSAFAGKCIHSSITIKRYFS